MKNDQLNVVTPSAHNKKNVRHLLKSATGCY